VHRVSPRLVALLPVLAIENLAAGRPSLLDAEQIIEREEQRVT